MIKVTVCDANTKAPILLTCDNCPDDGAYIVTNSKDIKNIIVQGQAVIMFNNNNEMEVIACFDELEAGEVYTLEPCQCEITFS